jgi:hypothetical protein
MTNVSGHHQGFTKPIVFIPAEEVQQWTKTEHDAFTTMTFPLLSGQGQICLDFFSGAGRYCMVVYCPPHAFHIKPSSVTKTR